MKKLIYLIFSLFLIVGCQKNDPMQYEGEAAIYFRLDKEWLKDVDSLTYSFVGKEVAEDTLWLRVDVQGYAANEPRTFGLQVNEAQTTAEADLHYGGLKQFYTMPAKAYYCRIPVIFYKKDPLLDDATFYLVLELTGTDELKPGITRRTRVKIGITNQLKKPDYWDEVIESEFGVYSRVKHENCIRELKTDFPPTAEEYADNRSRWTAYGKYMSMFFEENYPILNEDKIAIEPW